jgi:beta-glucosidase
VQPLSLSKLRFWANENFLFGSAASTFQVEGSPAPDGKGQSIWDMFTHRRGKSHTGENADVACDRYAHPERDIDLMGEFGWRAYRFSVFWSRVPPAI